MLLRDWLSNELLGKLNEVKGISAVIIQAVYRSRAPTLEYAFQQRTAPKLQPLVRGALERIKYYQKKWCLLDQRARGLISEEVRATRARVVYYEQRKAFLEEEQRKAEEEARRLEEEARKAQEAAEVAYTTLTLTPNP